MAPKTMRDEWTVTLERRGGIVRRWRAEVTHGAMIVGEVGHVWRALTPARLVAKVAKQAARDRRGKIVINVRERGRCAG
jgi:hypothetical protein